MIRQPGATSFTAPEIASYGDEAQLQQLIADNPSLLPGIDAGPPVVVFREFPLPVGRADVVLVDLEGAISVCECKLQTNPQVRREVIGQLVSYAGALSKMSYSDFSKRAEAKLGQPLTEALAAQAEGEFDHGAFHPALAANLAAGRFRLVIVVDEISNELRDAVLYLNDQTKAEFYALELAYLGANGMEILIPVVYGQETVERKPKVSTTSVERADTVIVAANKLAYDEYRRLSAYICQPASSPGSQKTRTFRPDLQRLGFYRNKQIEPEIARIIKHYPSVPFTSEEAVRLQDDEDPSSSRLGQVIEKTLAEGGRHPGPYQQVFLLTGPNDPETLRLPQPILHQAPFAWTQHQRYTLEAALNTFPKTTEELAAAVASVAPVSDPSD